MQESGKRKAVIVGETDTGERRRLEVLLTCEKYAIKVASGADGIWTHLGSRDAVSAVVLGSLPRRNGAIDLLCDIRRYDPGLPVIVILDSLSPQEIVRTVKCGATDVLVKPVEREELCRTVRDAMEHSRGGTAGEPVMPAGFSGSSPGMQQLMAVAHRVAASEAPVLIQGETGVGKEVLARHLHRLSPRARKPFLKVNCAALPAELLESELFGYNRGAFTGAVQNKPGMFELADTGVILLDEIGEMDLRLQAKLLHVLQDQQYRRLGGSEVIRVNVRVLAATQTNLEAAQAHGAFRADLYYRLNVINLHVPPLRERRDDVLSLAQLLLERHSRPGVRFPAISPELQSALLSYHWPGNVRELENVIRRLLILGDPELLVAELNSRREQTPARPSEPDSVKYPAATAHRSRLVMKQISEDSGDREVQAITAALHAARWNRKVAAVLLGTGYKALLYKMKKLGIIDTEAPIVPRNRTVAHRGDHRTRTAND